MDQINMLTWREPEAAEHMNYFNTTGCGPPTEPFGGHDYSLEGQYNYSFPAYQSPIEQHNLSHQFGYSATSLSHQVNQTLLQQHQQQFISTGMHAGVGPELNRHAYSGNHGPTASGAYCDQSSHRNSPIGFNDDHEAALSALRSTGRVWSGAMEPSTSAPEVTTAARGKRYERNREKNRLAASKCRDKSKKYIDELREREQELASQRASLLQHAARLREEVLWLKNEVLRHGDCHCELIQSYLAAAVRHIAQ
ncbi:hypothetical protein PG985_005567 [Apiospora marii]|uniref:BZIP domain-containing protein n=1 Tax=Apiospora marii TaxID=335849 RepID=A0ABR1RJK3_9PEZI